MNKKIVAAIFMCAVMVLVAAVPLAMADTHYLTKGAGGPRASAQTWEYEPPGLGTWSGHVVNNGLRWLVIKVFDNTSGVPDLVAKQHIRFAAFGAYPTGEVDTISVPMSPGQLYEINATPNGPKGATCSIEDRFDMASPPVAVITVLSIDYLSVSVSGSLSTDADGTIDAYDWEFGDGSVASGMEATHTYASDGTYTITLTVTDNEGLSGTDTELVTVAHQRLPPVASFTATMDWMIVSVDASASTDNFGPIQAYDWNFGDGMTASGKTATHTYAAEGMYMITLVVTDSDGEMDDATAMVEAKMPNIPPVAVWSWNALYLDVNFDGSASYDTDGTIVSWVWDFGDGTSGMGEMVSHSYAASGTHMVTLTVTDNEAATGSDTKAVMVESPPVPPVAVWSWTAVYLDASFDGSGSYDPDGGAIVSWAWDFGDGMSGMGATTSHSYVAKGTYMVTLTVTDDEGQTGSDTKAVMVDEPPPLEPPVAVWSWSAVYLAASFDGSASYDNDGTIMSWAWNFGDGMSGMGATTSHTYAAAGTYMVTLTVTDNDGLTGANTKAVTVDVKPLEPPVAVWSWSAVYLAASFDGSASYDNDGTVVAWAWDFGDGMSGMGATTSHSYAAAGTYMVTLTVTDNDGLTGSNTKAVSVEAPPVPPVAVWSWSALYLAASFDGSASSDSDGTVVAWAWDFGDGMSGMGATTSHSYANAGTYMVTLTVTDNDGLTGSDTKAVTVELPPAPTAMFTPTVTGMSVSVDASASTGVGLTYSWEWGDGTTGSGMTASHTYASSMAAIMDTAGKSRAPGPPHPVWGMTWDASYNPINGCTVTVTVVRTGESVVYVQEAESNIYSIDMSQFQNGYAIGDMLHVYAEKGTWTGFTDAPVTNSPEGYDQIDVFLSPGIEPPTYTITLTVTDAWGRTATYSAVVTLSP